MSTAATGEQFAEDFLAHFGVKGMKWGIRKEPDPHASTESRSERKSARKNVQQELFNRMANEPLFREMTRAEFDALSTTGETFAAGTTMKRVTVNPSVELKGATYVSTLKEDSDFYKAVMPAYGPSVKGLGGAGRKKYADNYEVTMKTIEKLSSPSEKERVDTYISLLETPSIKVKGKNAPITGREYLEKQGFKPVLRKRYDTEELAMKSWYSFVQSQGNQGNPLAEAYFTKLQEKGYKLIPDDNDAQALTKKPIVLLDPQSAVQVDSVRRLSADEINQAQRELKGRS